ncbi:MEDS domain-containing protein [Bacillus shivajii]|uniref:MEDS domain-containing protein n=1 Tax=Bacillus shivajii TaxID=1983719 RepID=UPI001CFA63C1|nr:MEDS domain-containing protein [Bacillus shivajii]UCZ55188.1 MEDS domain-containing protein [Bacillus shivajii]
MSSNDLAQSKVSLSTNVELYNGAHVLYTYTDKELYLENAVAFISKGLSLGQRVILLESKDVYQYILKRLTEKNHHPTELESILFHLNEEYYGTNDTFDVDNIMKKYKEIIEPIINDKKPTRLWGNVIWKESQGELLAVLKQYEEKVDEIVKEKKALTVCCYDGNKLSANIQLELMKSHEYLMTDSHLYPSSLYSGVHVPSVYQEEDLEEKISLLNKEITDINTHFKNLIEELPDAVFISSGAEILYANKAGIELVSSDFHEVVHKSVLDLIHSDYHELLKDNLNKIKLGKSIPLTEMEIITSNGDIVDVEIVSFPFVLGRFTNKTAISIVRNITDRKQNQQLKIRAEKLSMAGHLAASIAHEIRNPLTSIKGFLQLAKHDAINFDHYSIIDSELNRIETIASELLSLGKPLSKDVKKQDVGKFLKDVCTLLQSQAIMKKIEIICDDIEDGCYVFCNEGQMKQVFINIIKNAIEAMDNGGAILAKAKCSEEEVIVEISDEGKGMPKELVEKLGQPFHTTKETGTGLGLMVCFNIIEQHNGDISVSSVQGKETCFTISFPRDND